MSYAVADGVRIRIHHLGGTGPGLLCMHATGFHGRVWEPFVPRLRERFSIVALDQRGHGDSDKPASGYEWEKFGDDILAVVDHLGLSNLTGLGHSAGATALVFAETTRHGTFDQLILMDPTMMPPELRRAVPQGLNPMAEQARRRKAVWSSHEEMIERLRRGSPLSDWREDFLRAYVTYGTTLREDGSFELKCPPEIEAQVYATASAHNGWDRLSDIDCRTLLLTGETSPMWSGERGGQAASRLRSGRAEVVKGGHFFPMENPDHTADRILRFLEE